MEEAKYTPTDKYETFTETGLVDMNNRLDGIHERHVLILPPSIINLMNQHTPGLSSQLGYSEQHFPFAPAMEYQDFGSPPPNNNVSFTSLYGNFEFEIIESLAIRIILSV